MHHQGSILLVVALLFLAGAGCDGSDDEAGAAPPPPTPQPEVIPFSLPQGFSASVFAEDLALPTSIAFAPDGSGRLFVNELQTGRIRIVQNGELLAQPFATIATNVSGGFPVSGENGLLGLAFDPQFAANGYVYVTYAERVSGGGHLGAVARLTANGNRGEAFTVLLDGIPAAPGHQIQSLAFGPDGKLYVSVGDAYLDAQAQNLNSPLGKILRMNPDGSIPDDNPFPGSYTYAYGLRNCFDLAFDADGTLFTADNGPEINDEFNRIVAGGNYGWPARLGAHPPVDDLIPPLHTWQQIVSPDGMAFYRGTQFPERYRGKLFLVLFGFTASTGPNPLAKRVQVVDVGDGTAPPVFEDFAVYTFGGMGNPLDVTEGPDGNLYLADIFQGKIYRIRYGG